MMESLRISPLVASVPANLAWWMVTALCMLCLGASLLVLMQQLTGGKWFQPVQGILRKTAAFLPLTLLLFIPVFLFSDALYWMDPKTPHTIELAHKREAFLNLPFFLSRYLLYLTVATLAALHCLGRKVARLPAAPVLLFTALSSIFMITDFVIVRVPAWWSSAFPFTMMVAGTLMAFSVSILLSGSRISACPEKVRKDLGNLLLANLVLFLYFLLMELIISYSGDLPPRRVLYSERMNLLALTPVIITFAGAATPAFFALLCAAFKTNTRRLQWAAAALGSFVLSWLWWYFTPLS